MTTEQKAMAEPISTSKIVDYVFAIDKDGTRRISGCSIADLAEFAGRVRADAFLEGRASLAREVPVVAITQMLDYAWLILAQCHCDDKNIFSTTAAGIRAFLSTVEELRK